MKISTVFPFFLIFFSLLAAPTSLKAQWGNWRNNKEIKGNGQIKKEDRSLDNFEGVETCCSIEVFIRQGSNYQVSIEADENLLEHISTQVEQGRLAIRPEKGRSLNPSQRIKVYVSMPEMVSLQASSSSRVWVEDIFPSKELRIEISSSAAIELPFEGEELHIEGSSSGKVKLRGKAKQSHIEVSSSCHIEAEDFLTQKLRMEGSSSGRVAIGVADELRAELSSSARLRYSGSPEKVITETNSGAKVYKLD